MGIKPIERLRGERQADPSVYARLTERVERLAVEAVMATERSLGRVPVEMPRNNPGYDIRSKDPETGDTVLNKPDRFILALVEVAEDDSTQVRYLRHPFAGTKDAYFAVTRVNYGWEVLWSYAVVVGE